MTNEQVRVYAELSGVYLAGCWGFSFLAHRSGYLFAMPDGLWIVDRTPTSNNELPWSPENEAILLWKSAGFPLP